MSRIQLTKNFHLDEFLVSQTAARNGISMDPPLEVEDNLRQLCVDILQPLRDVTDRPIFISSGYRPPQLNVLVGGSTTSAHMSGEAADFTVSGQSPLESARIIRDMKLPYDQLILEFGRWVHASIARRQELTASLVDGKTKYDFGLLEV